MGNRCAGVVRGSGDLNSRNTLRTTTGKVRNGRDLKGQGMSVIESTGKRAEGMNN